jgi:hypothetical protein
MDIGVIPNYPLVDLVRGIEPPFTMPHVSLPATR